MERTENISELASFIEADAEQVRKLLSFWNKPDFRLQVIEKNLGGNNTVLKLMIEDKTYALKKYNLSNVDKRNRMDTEWNFTNLVKNVCGELPIPSPIAVHKDAGLAIFEFIEGTCIEANSLTTSDVLNAADFIRKLNSPTMRKNASHLPNASDAEFSILGHINFLENKLSELKHIKRNTKLLQSLAREIHTYLEKSIKNVRWIARDEGIDENAEIPLSERCLSPSDFGYHNAIRRKTGTLAFIDFEYAGWDDPAKLFADFFLQPKVPVPEKYEDLFLKSCLSHLGEDKLLNHKRRANLLKPFFRLRWCFILLNPLREEWAIARGLDKNKTAYEKTCISRINSAAELLKFTV